MVKKSAFTLIELIFAIVIIAISVVSLPMMNQAIAKGVDANIVQEAIFAASTKLNEAVSSHWDENSIESESNASNSYFNNLARVIDLGECENNSSLSTFRERPGHINEPLHRRCLDLNATAPDDGANTTTLVDDINDLVTTDTNLTNNQLVSQAGYKKKYKVSIAVSRPANFGEATTNPNQNIKEIKVSIKDENGKLLTSLKTYSANIGEVDYSKRTF